MGFYFVYFNKGFDRQMNTQCLYVACTRCGQILKELTKEEISDIRDKYLSPQDCDIYTFAKAILEKAQEK